MSKVYRMILFLIAMYLYYLFIIDIQDPVAATGKILLVTLMLVAMELVHRKGNKKFDEESDLKKIDDMGQDKFTKYICELFKKQGYQIRILEGNKNYDFRVITPKEIIGVKSIYGEANTLVDRQTIEAICASERANKVKRSIIVTNQDYNEDAKVFADQKGAEVINRLMLKELIYEVSKKDNREPKRIKAQEA